MLTAADVPSGEVALTHTVHRGGAKNDSFANRLAPEQLPYISRQYAQQLEFKGEYENALKMYESALNAMDDEGNLLASDAQQTTCMAGIAVADAISLGISRGGAVGCSGWWQRGQ